MSTPVHLSSQLAVNVLDAHSLLAAFGVLGVGVVLFAETGLLIGFFLPGDSLLFTAGLLCTGTADSGVKLSLGPLLVAAAVGALAGAQCGYLLGRRAGGALLARSHSPRLHRGAHRAEELLEKYGHAKAIVLARFVPVVRTVLNPVAGALQVPVRTFTLWQIAGGLVWSVGLTLAGYALGSSIPNVDRYLLPLVALIVVVSLTPLLAEVYRARRNTASKGGDR
ncbi:membrane protein [Streptomyces sp. NRRL WC-3618]|uniref:DedA family protein n=1 Tax=Streptomyces sp. NRRL WC-3618 TaxID=1519490 RepID=UPI0006AFA31C|nr:DedA family protein [Streptomyces sp. NRRL WC-3618]KOV84104.1 membrane protein [Streptomyces sp. NRRL WC-3618]